MFLVNNSFLELKHRYLLEVRLKAINYYKKLLYYLCSYISFLLLTIFIQTFIFILFTI